ncbi:MAG: glutathione S-transferase [Pseudomonadota bacterium]
MSDPTPVLYLGNWNYSSWSLRPWLCLRWGNISFEDQFISLAQEGYGTGEIEEVLAVSPTGRVPALHAGDTHIWDSLAIAEWAAEQAPALWPADPAHRAVARSAVCEMHAGFPDLRDQLPMNINRRCKAHSLREGTHRDIRRVLSLWTSLRERYGQQGPWLLGNRSIVDAFYAPVAARFRTYAIEFSGPAADYTGALFADPDFRFWEDAPSQGSFDFIDEVFA